MIAPPFSLELVQFLADHRTDNLTKFFLLVSECASLPVYGAIIIWFYVARSKQLAIRLAVILICAQSLNRVLKLVIRNPRPFVNEGTFLDKWAELQENVPATASEFSTPSGHAMASAAFYSGLFASVKNRYLRVLAVLAIVVIGVSRPYLGVHYFEDVLIGWAIGLACAVVLIRYWASICTRWKRLSFPLRIGIAVATSLTLSFMVMALNDGHLGDSGVQVLSDTGFLTAIVIACPLEERTVNFDPASSPFAVRFLRFIFTSVMVLLVGEFLGNSFGFIFGESTPFWYVHIYLRSAVEGFVCFFVAPLLFTRLGLAKTMAPQAK